MNDAWIGDVAASAWLVPILFALVVGDAFLVVLPSEAAVVALAALSTSTGSPSLVAIIPVAAAGAVVGDGLCYLIGRRIGLDRWHWQRTGRIGTAITRVRSAVHRRTAVLVFTARYVPFARIAVNLAAGAGRVPLRRYFPLSIAAGIAWAVFNVSIGAVVGELLGDSPLVAIAISVPTAIVLGLAVDRVLASLDARRASRLAGLADSAEAPPGPVTPP
ncbi:DedA family protein [Agromyces sp. CCNWLW203]|uniref:DedA family protein n=1 Tax=Agromyces sp. CCNWLW203 TaxID=3112842 RepID=UPI002F96DD36